MTPEERQKAINDLCALYGDDAIFRPSSIERTMHCHGSVRLSALAPRKKVKNPIWIVEGLAAHKVVEEALRGNRQPEEWSDRLVQTDKEGLEGTFCDEEMVEGANLYLDFYKSRLRKDTQIFIEHKLSLKPIDPDDPIMNQNRGTADLVLIHAADRELEIIDLKYGKGYMVPADTPQTKNYATMGLVNFGVDGGWKKVTNTIVQPRASDENQRVKTIELDPSYLLGNFLGSLVEAMESALEPDPPLQPGKWCRWCPAKLNCPAIRNDAINIAADPFEGGNRYTASSPLGALPAGVFVGTHEQPRPTAVGRDIVVLPAPTALDPGEIATILDRRHLWEMWITALEHRAVQMLESGITIPGWELDRRSGNRKWIDPEAAKAKLIALGVTEDKLYAPRKMRSPRQVEDALPAAQKSLIGPLVERPLTGVVLVPATRQNRKAEITPALGPVNFTD